jgi:MFS family permease
MVALVLFAAARGTAWLVAARAVQGLGQGMMSGAATAALAELVGVGQERQAALLATLAQSGGSAAGVLTSGMLAQWAPAPEVLPYVAGMAACACAVVLLRVVPETAPGQKGGALLCRPARPAYLQPGPAGHGQRARPRHLLCRPAGRAPRRPPGTGPGRWARAAGAGAAGAGAGRPLAGLAAAGRRCGARRGRARAGVAGRPGRPDPDRPTGPTRRGQRRHRRPAQPPRADRRRARLGRL